ncbi:uncharacterized protein LOC141649400 [Silene latifolia]|uniref:uncharacterized protein LOC141649400 n=1 Tax=Silene latifolia TaxID=37657 RepID=UPI003D7744B0
MARSTSSKSPKKHRNSTSSNEVVKESDGRTGSEKKKGPDEEDVLRTKPMHEVNPVPGLSFEDEENPDASIQWVTKRGKKNGKNSVVVQTVDSNDENNDTEMDELLQFTNEDVSEEIAYWNQAVYCFVLGANPPWEVVQGYVHRIWGRHGIDKISFLPNGIFLVRFKEMKDKEEVLNAGYHMFDNKPLIVKPWQENVDLLKKEVKVVPAWIRIHGLPLKFWGSCLPAIAGLVGPYVKSDAATVEKTRLGFARTMVELKVGQAFPSAVKFRDENGQIVQLKVEYEWKPILCEKCKGLGHEGKNCRRDQHRQVQAKPVVPRVKEPAPESAATAGTPKSPTIPEAAAGVPDSDPAVSGDDNQVVEVTDITDEELDDVGIQVEDIETKINGVNVGNIAHNMLEGWSVTTNCSLHKGGRVWLLWRPNIFEVQIIQYDPQFIHSKVIVKATQKSFLLTFVYAFNEGSERLDLWDKLRTFARPCTPWAIAGDFNTVLSPDERLGVATKQEDMEAFVDCLADCGMTDIHATGAYFTWTNKQDPDHRKYSRLDRFLINQDWLDEFPDMNAHFHPEGIMDHTPCIVRNTRLDGRRNTSFKYFNMWGSAPEFLEIVQHTWSQQIIGTKMFGVVKKLKALKGELRKMNRKCFSDVELRANQAIVNLENVQLQIEDDYDRTDLIALELQALDEVKYWSKARDSFLQQKAKAQWLNEGDSNTAYFHSAIKSRCLRNKIVQIEDQKGNLCTDTISIQRAFLNFYQGLMGSQKGTEQVRSVVLQTGPFCNENHIASLLAPVTKEEIKGVVFAIPIDKAPGPDGYTSGFFRDSWDIVGDDVCNAIMEFFISGRMLNQINATNITLIPKCDRPTTVSHFRPIACCNMVYKVISKLLCNRLAMVLPDIIHENQGAFIKGRSIIENVLICQDIVHLYARKAVTPRCLFKIDLQKAYDTIEWDFVEQMLHGLKFPAHFIQLVMQCVRSTTFTLSLNGSNFGYFKGQRGLRQGDPISPLLFTICMEYLTRLIKFATDRWPFQYHPLCKNLKLTHLMFADDLLLFCKGKPQSIWLLMRAFSSFSKASGLAMNNAKSEIFFNGVDDDIKEGIKMVTGFREGTMPFRYLGVPIKAGRLTKTECSALTEKCAEYPSELLGPNDGSFEYHRVPLVAWDKVTLPKKEGGLGIRRADSWNIAIVDKLVDWIYCKADRLWIKWVSDVYIKDHDWHCYTPPTDATWVWKNICKVKEKLKTGYADGSWTVSPKGYSIRSGYDWLSPDHIQLDWPAIVWSNWNIPKHSMTTWLRMQEGMNVKSKLVRFGCCTDDLCLLCQLQPETVEHMFTTCVYAIKIQSCLVQWYGGCFPTVNDLIATQRDSIQWKVKVAMFNAFTYSIWYQRNNARVNDCLMRPELVAPRIEEDVRRRIKLKCGNVADQPVCGWLQSMGVI